MSHILVVEDELHLAQGIQFNLQAEGYEVTVCDNGTSALSTLADQEFDLVILDLMLPGMSGYEVCESLRRDGHEVPVLILSARTLTEDRTRGFHCGEDQYLTKPFELDELLARVQSLLSRHVRQDRRTRPDPSNMRRFRLGKALVDFDTFEVRTDEGTKQMTALEIRMLKYLMENEGRVVTRQELLENVWDRPGYLQTRAPDQFIRRLRKVFEIDPAEPKHFVTIRDAGYRFIAQPDRNQDRVVGS